MARKRRVDARAYLQAAEKKAASKERQAKRKDHRDRIRRALLKHERTEVELCEEFGISKTELRSLLKDFEQAGANITRRGDHLHIDRHLAPRSEADWKIVGKTSEPYRFGFIADTHLGSQHERLDVCNELYDWFVEQGVSRVFHCGNWIEGEARFNKHELVPEAHGMQNQLDYMVEHYPARDGVTTYYVAGDDHEGWYSQREGVDIGRMLQDTAERAGRSDLVYLGYKEAFVTLEHPKTGKRARMLIDHPGGGSAYALSYAAQKRVEAAQSGEKPAIWAFGHWHKHGYFVIRGVHCLLVPCTKDLDTFGRKKGLEYTVGGIICDFWQDDGGAIVGAAPQFKLYYDRGYHNQQYTMSGPLRKRRI